MSERATDEYEPPELTEYGSVAELTRQRGRGNGQSGGGPELPGEAPMSTPPGHGGGKGKGRGNRGSGGGSGRDPRN